MAEVTLPVVGPVSKRALAIGGVAAGGVMLLLYLRKRNAAPAAAVPTDTSGLDTSGLDTSGMAGGGGSLTGPSVPTVQAVTSNPQWTAAAMQALGGVVDPSALSSALGKYLTGAAVTPGETSLIDQAIAAEGWPPVSGPNGYPPAIRTQASGGQTNPPPPPPPRPPSVPKTSNVLGGWHVNQYLNDLNTGYPGLGLTYSKLLSLNPGLSSKIDTSSVNDPRFKSNATINIR